MLNSFKNRSEKSFLKWATYLYTWRVLRHGQANIEALREAIWSNDCCKFNIYLGSNLIKWLVLFLWHPNLVWGFWVGKFEEVGWSTGWTCWRFLLLEYYVDKSSILQTQTKISFMGAFNLIHNDIILFLIESSDHSVLSFHFIWDNFCWNHLRIFFKFLISSTFSGQNSGEVLLLVPPGLPSRNL